MVENVIGELWSELEEGRVFAFLLFPFLLLHVTNVGPGFVLHCMVTSVALVVPMLVYALLHARKCA